MGTGKSTQSKKLSEFLKTKFPNKEIIWTFEPGGDEIAKAIRQVVQATQFTQKMEAVCEAYLYASSRAQTLRTIVQSGLARGAIVISDRSFITSLAYQGFGRKMGTDFILEINKAAIEAASPDVIVFLNLDPVNALKRASDAQGDKFETENLDFYERVIKGYKKISRLPMFKGKWSDVDAEGDISDVFTKILKKISH